jgi:2'-5' RNA ligase
MPKINYIKLDLPNQLKQEIYQTGQWIKENYKNQFDFCNMEYDDIHMTICFIGSHLKGKKLGDQVEGEMKNFPFSSYQNTNIQFDKYDLFPEIKENLIVARFDPPKSFIKDVIDFQKRFCQKFGIPADKYYFAPHITMGKIQNKNDKMKVNLSKITKINSTITPNKFILV